MSRPFDSITPTEMRPTNRCVLVCSNDNDNNNDYINPVIHVSTKKENEHTQNL